MVTSLAKAVKQEYYGSMNRFYTGSILIGFGFLVLLANLDVVGVRDVLSHWWPALVFGAAAGLSFFSTTRNYLLICLLLALGTIVQLNLLNVANVDLGTIIFPAILVLVGVSLISQQRYAKEHNSEEGTVSALMGGVDQISTSKAYKGGNINAVMGGVKLDLRKATFAKGASLNVFAFWGGIELIVPEDVVVKTRASVIMGGVEDKSYPTHKSDAPVLYLDGIVLMSGVNIKR